MGLPVWKTGLRDPVLTIRSRFPRPPLPTSILRATFSRSSRRDVIRVTTAAKQRGGFRLDTKSAALKGGETFAPDIRPGHSADSPLIRLVAGLEEGMQMPPEGDRLTAEQIGLLRAWIDKGADWPEAANADGGATHWSFRAVQKPIVPEVPDESARWARNPIDSFVAARLNAADAAVSEQKVKDKIEPGGSRPPLRISNAEADRFTLIRRLSFDLLGLPPTPDDVAEFVDDRRPDAWERLVDRLLASPHFGERWARHWLDVVRFAESDGFETNQPRPNAWPYRDYVIRSFNEDKPYDRFVLEQLAGDAFGVDEATGFVVGGAYDRVKSPDPGLTAQQRADELHDMVSTTGSAFLGLTVGCARCHNHKFDPISQLDYHGMKAVFAGVQHGERPLNSADAADRERTSKQLKDELARIKRCCARSSHSLTLQVTKPADRATGSRRHCCWTMTRPILRCPTCRASRRSFQDWGWNRNERGRRADRSTIRVTLADSPIWDVTIRTGTTSPIGTYLPGIHELPADSASGFRGDAAGRRTPPMLDTFWIRTVT